MDLCDWSEGMGWVSQLLSQHTCHSHYYITSTAHLIHNLLFLTLTCLPCRDLAGQRPSLSVTLPFAETFTESDSCLLSNSATQRTQATSCRTERLALKLNQDQDHQVCGAHLVSVEPLELPPFGQQDLCSFLRLSQMNSPSSSAINTPTSPRARLCKKQTSLYNRLA